MLQIMRKSLAVVLELVVVVLQRVLVGRGVISFV
jgi:hypothetical protein